MIGTLGLVGIREVRLGTGKGMQIKLNILSQLVRVTPKLISIFVCANVILCSCDEIKPSDLVTLAESGPFTDFLGVHSRLGSINSCEITGAAYHTLGGTSSAFIS